MAENNRRNSTGYNRDSNSRGDSSRGNTHIGNSRTSATRNTPSNKRSNGGRSGANVVGMISVVLVMIIVIGGVVGVLTWTNLKYLYDNITIVPGVEVEGVDIGGLTRDEAYLKLNKKLEEKINKLSISLKHGEQYWTYDAASLNASGDISGIIDEAMVYGHTGNLRNRIDQAKYVLDNPETFNITFGYDQNSVRQIVEAIKEDIDVPAVEPNLEFDEDAGKITGIEHRTALQYNPLKYDTMVNLNGASAEVYIGEDGNYHIKGEIFKITQGSSGYEVDVDATVNAIITDLADDSVANVNIVTTQVHPTLTEEKLKECTSLVYHSKSGIASSSPPSRDSNVATALAAFDGLVIKPGEQVSFDAITGERSAANGYELAIGIGQDKSHKLVYGGGVCQAATVIFNAALMSGCTIVDKESHSYPLYYQEDDFGTEARDAMVNWGTSDLVFRNDTEYPIYFDTYVNWRYPDDADYAYCNAYTKLLSDGQSIKYEPRLMEKKEVPEPEYKALGDMEEPFDSKWKWNEELGLLVSQYKPSKPYKLYDVYQQILDANGNVITEQHWYYSEYGEIVGLYYTKPDPSKEESDDGAG